MDFKELSKKIILIDSSPQAGTEEIAHFAAEISRQCGLEVTLQEGALLEKKQFNIIARPRGSSLKKEVIFQTHLDTVDPGPHAFWTETDQNPFKATFKDGKVFGLGVADVKLDFLCKLRALKEFSNTKLKKPFALVGTYGEELGMEGVKQLLQSKIIDPHMAIIGEPSELQIVYANNGYGVWKFDIPFLKEELEFIRNHQEICSATTQEKIFHGKAAHSSTPHLGENALLKMVEYLNKLPKGLGLLEAHGGTVANTVPAFAHIEMDAGFVLSPSLAGASTRLILLVRELQRLEREFLNFENKAFSPATPTLNIGVLRTTEKSLSLTVSFRVTPQITKTQLDLWNDKLLKFCEKNEVKIDFEEMTEPAITPLDSELIQGAMEISKKLGLKEKPITKASGTECSIYRLYGIDCMVIGPGISMGNSHTVNEHNILSQLDRATEFYTEAVKRFCL